jgi:glycosyltransferase involved in cell wall biosynthesis
METPVSVVVLTKDEAAHVEECLRAVLSQLRSPDEIVVVDSASRDRTVEIVEGFSRAHPGVVRMLASSEHLSFGAARNTGVQLAQHDVIVFVSANAVPEPGWLDELRAVVHKADIVYGRQRHAPGAAGVATVARGLRYRHFEDPSEGLPERYASNANAAYRRYAFQSLRFDEEALGAEDVAFAKAARLAGLRIAYAPRAIVRHKDVATIRTEWTKHRREGEAYAQLRKLLGAPRMHIAWAVAVAGVALITVVSQQWWLLGVLGLVFFAPTLRRLFSPAARQYKPLPLLGAAALSPFFDLAFVGSYVKRRWRA